MRNKLARLSFVPPLILGIGLAALGLFALNHIVDNWWPFDVARLDLIRATALGQSDPSALMSAANSEAIFAFLAAIMLVFTGVAMPIAGFLNKRFALSQGSPVPEFLVVLRQAMWVGLWATFCVWLQMNRVFGMAIAILVAAVLLLFEFLLQVRSRTVSVRR